MACKVEISEKAQKDLKKVPLYIREKLYAWSNAVTEQGIEETRKINGYQDKTLAGIRFGQRSIRLNNAYRAFYIERKNDDLITVIEVNKHEY